MINLEEHIVRIDGKEYIPLPVVKKLFQDKSINKLESLMNQFSSEVKNLGIQIDEDIKDLENFDFDEDSLLK